MRRFLESKIWKPHSYLLYIMIPVYGTFVIQLVYNLKDGLYFDYAMTVLLWVISFVLVSHVAIMFALLTIIPASYPVRAIFQGSRYQKPLDLSRKF